MDNIAVEFITRVQKTYSDERYFKEIDSKYRSWIENVRASDDKKILNNLLCNIRFFSKTEIKSILEGEISKLKESYDGLNDVVILPLNPINGRYNGSNELVSLIKEIDIEAQFNGTRLLPYRDSIINDLQYAKAYNTLIFVDDISGTGGTARKFINSHYAELKGKKVIFLFLSVTEQAIKEFNTLTVEYNEAHIEFIYYIKLEKLSAINILSTAQYARLSNIEEGLWGKNHNNILGYKNSELLVLFSHNIPNNTVSCLWYFSEVNPKKWNRLFTRITAPNRKRQNYSNSKRSNV
ncbi:phosphoribosyltransferase-like protein [Paenisporosarcina antarctica]|uniref:PRTase-CE domain-containing protein n=1 Tax=Paenisporosarcina antarctica TaxID=417367 RepID=A0A4P6ZXC0_9BACL|nr:hypothetical protein [Paenisporosarcina antarctica]QBP40156.1 hypothetical protein E2636_02870 [Paenisporosarcina antarctica]